MWEVSGGEQLRQMSKEVRFKTGMINDHMPWAYNKIFSGHTLIALHVSHVSLTKKYFQASVVPTLLKTFPWRSLIRVMIRDSTLTFRA